MEGRASLRWPCPWPRGRYHRSVGHRANLVIVDGNGWRLHYSHWAANGIYRWLAAGPDAAVAFVVAQQQVDSDSGWLDDVWAEGGLVIDTVARRLLWYGNDMISDLPERRAYFRLLAATWTGWRVDWAYDGIGDLAAYVGVDRMSVRAIDMAELTAPPRAADELDQLVLSEGAERTTDRAGPYELVTIRTADGDRAWVLDHDRGGHLAWLGPTLTDQVPGPGFDRLRLSGLPSAGVHIDLPTREVGIWTAETCPGLLPAVGARWPAWTVTFWGESYEHQLAAAGHAVTMPVCDERSALDRLADALLSRPRTNPLVSFTEIVEREQAAGKQIEVNPAAFQHTETELDDADLRLLAIALAKVAADLAGA
jgi:hypothetical protein